jgi:phosphatidylglycerophosphate synthase
LKGNYSVTNYSNFKEKCARSDSIANDNIHFFSKNFAPFFGYLLHRLGFSPNACTFLFGVTGFASSISIYYEMGIVSYVCWRLHIILDMADGNIARVSHKFSQSAVGFDRSLHIIINTSYLLFSMKSISSPFLLSLLTVTFYLYYFFDRNYIKEKSNSKNYSVWKNILKNIISLEGFVLMTCILTTFKLDFYLYIIMLYSVGFCLLYILKLKMYISKNIY